GTEYTLDVYSIMPNHVHAVFEPLMLNNLPKPLSLIMHSLKRHTAERANRILNRTGKFWEHESFDHYIRNRAEWKRIVEYVLENPVKAGLVKSWTEWPWNYVRGSLAKPDASYQLALHQSNRKLATPQVNNLRYSATVPAPVCAGVSRRVSPCCRQMRP